MHWNPGDVGVWQEFTEEEATGFRAEGERVLEEAWSFPTGWEEWSPDPTWLVPQVPGDPGR